MLLIGLSLAASALVNQAALPPVISSGKQLRPGTYRITSPEDLSKPAITLRGDNLVLDFKGVNLEGTAPTVEPDQRRGLGVLVQGKNVTIKNLKVRGYKVALMALGADGLKLVDCDFSYNWKQHLKSTQEKEDLADWMSYHQNEKDEWLRYGAAMYLRDVDRFEIRGTKVHGGQNGLMLTNCNRGLIWNNDFSFNSSLGIGMYRSSENRIMHNKIDWNVRGFSYGVYNRGQDSAGILIYEQSNKNVFAYNSVTHGGDGFFLWAGQTTMDTGQGGCNDNLLYGNDFSHAPTNGIEATFSRNNFVNNLILECWHGIWGGYSYDSKVVGNVFGYNAEAIAWEHGQDNLVANNRFYRDNEGIYIWSNPTQDPNWGYGKKRDTRSRDWSIDRNVFSNTFSNSLRFRRTQDVRVANNLFAKVGNVLREEAEVTGVSMQDNQTEPGTPEAPASSLNQGTIRTPEDYLNRFRLLEWNPSAVPDLQKGRDIKPFYVKPSKGGQRAFLSTKALRGWRYIIVDEWGPYDFERPLLWPREEVAKASSVSTDHPTPQVSSTRRFEILGPLGKWRLVSIPPGVKLSSQQGEVPGFVDVTLPAGTASNIDIQLEYLGGKTTDYRGIETPAGKPVGFGYKRFFAPIDWTIRFYKWLKPESDAVHANPDEAALQEVFKGAPLKEIKSDRLDFAGYAFDKVTGNDHYATVADGVFTIPDGEYTLELTADDGARVWLDGKPLIMDAWKYQGPTAYSREVRLGGTHRIRVEHFQIDGYAALKLSLKQRGG